MIFFKGWYAIKSKQPTTNENKFMYFRQERIISTFSFNPLKMVDQFTYIGSNTLSTESDVNINPGKGWTATARLSIIWKSNIFA